MSDSPAIPAPLMELPEAAAGAGTPPRGPALFLHNMKALWAADPWLALRVDAVFDGERVAVESTRSGDWTARVTTPEGASIYLHSRYDPKAEAGKLAESVTLEDKFCFVVSGLGLGYHVVALGERLTGDAVILCVEPSLPMIATALCCVDLADMIASRRLVILIDADKARLHDRLGPFNTLMMLGAQFVQHSPSMRAATQAQQAVSEAITEFITFSRMSLMTLVSNSRITCRNIAMNLVHYVSTPPIDLLRDRFAGNPGIVVAAGPSLARNLAELATLKGRAVMVAVQTALKPMLQQGIRPDFVTSLDFHEMSQKFFEGVEGLEGTHLVAEPKATWHVLDHYPGPMSLLDSPWARLLIGDALAARDGLKAGATVAHLAFYLAVYMGCDPIIFVGQDLAYSGHVFYVPGVEIHQAWQGELNRFQGIEQKEWERIVRNRPILRRVPGQDGTTLYTDELLFTYLEQFEKDIAAVPARVINATQGGARIRGTLSMPLAEVAERFCQKAIDPERFAYREAVRWKEAARCGAAAKELGRRIEELDEAVGVCDELLRVLESLKGLTHDATVFNRRLGKVDELRARIQQSSRVYRIINSSAQLAEFRRFSADRRISNLRGDETERARRQIDRDIEFIGGVREGAIELRPVLAEALARLDGATNGP